MTHDPILEEITRRLGKRLRRLALATLRPEDWPRWLELDPEFQPDYAHYRARMDAAAAQLKAAGVATVEVVVLPDDSSNGRGSVASATVPVRDHSTRSKGRCTPTRDARTDAGAPTATMRTCRLRHADRARKVREAPSSRPTGAGRATRDSASNNPE